MSFVAFSSWYSRKLASHHKSPSITTASFDGAAESRHRRRRSSAQGGKPVQPDYSNTTYSPAAGSHSSGAQSTLRAIPGTPSGPMSLSRSPSPVSGGGWGSPGLTEPYENMGGHSSPRQAYGEINGQSKGNGVTWASPKKRNDEANGYPSFAPRSNGFFQRHTRKISESLPTFIGRRRSHDRGQKSRWGPTGGTLLSRLRTFTGNIGRRMRIRILMVFVLVLAFVLFYTTRSCPPSIAVTTH